MTDVEAAAPPIPVSAVRKWAWKYQRTHKVGARGPIRDAVWDAYRAWREQYPAEAASLEGRAAE